MSWGALNDIKSGSVGSTIPDVPEPTTVMRRRVQLVVCARAGSAVDATYLLDVLGLRERVGSMS